MSDLLEQIHTCVESGYTPDSLHALANQLETRLRNAPRARLLDIEDALGRDPFLLIGVIRYAADPGVRREAARLLAALTDNCACSGDEPPEPSFVQEDEAAETLGKRAIAPVRWLVEQGRL